MIHFDGIIFSWQKGGGVHRYFQELISRLGSAGIGSTVYLQKPNLGFPVAASEDMTIRHVGIAPDRLSGRTLGFVRKILSPINKMLMGRVLGHVSGGVFHSTYFTTYKNLKIPQVVTVHDMTYESFPEYFKSAGAKRHIADKKKCIDRADAIICVSESTKKALIRTYPALSESKIHVIYHGIDDAFNPQYDKAEADALLRKHKVAKPFFLFVGKQGTYKNFSFLLETFNSWDKKDQYQLIALPFVSESDLKLFYNTAKAFVFPSLDEGFGMPILESICCGARALASDIPVFREIGQGLPVFFDPRDRSSLIQALNSAHDLPALTDQEKQASRQKIQAEFSWRKCVDQTVAIYNSLLQ
jgi:glycosyltransferase involved in cell wall biosynthesis